MNNWLILDCNFICWRNFFALRGMSSENNTEVVYGFFSDLIQLYSQFLPAGVVFCWDVGKPLRATDYPPYKSGRKKQREEMPPEELQKLENVREHCQTIRNEYLPRLRFKNIWGEDGYEADDLMAGACGNIPEGDKAIIVTCDHDLFQCLSSIVSIYFINTKEMFTEREFTESRGIKPWQWSWVKAVAGCSSDNIEGVKGVGEKTAMRYLKKELKETSVAYSSIQNSESIIQRNLSLVTLPYPGTPVNKIYRDKLRKNQWDELMTELKMPTLENTYQKRRKRGQRKRKLF